MYITFRLKKKRIVSIRKTLNQRHWKTLNILKNRYRCSIKIPKVKLRNMVTNILRRCSFNHKTSNSKFSHRMEKPFHLASSFRVRSSLSNNESRWTKRTHCVSLDFVETSGDRIWFSRANLSITRSPRSNRDSNRFIVNSTWTRMYTCTDTRLILYL